VIAGSMRTLLGWFEAGLVNPHISHVVPLSDANRALELLETRQATGKVVVTM
jgi:NADPH2:quinone reductase